MNDTETALELWRDERAKRYPELAAAASAPPASPSSRKKGTP